jgi:hypothetical protein
VVVRTPLWEWSVARDARNSPVGVSMTLRGAMTALSRALVGGERPARGSVMPVVLVDATRSDPYYERLPVMYTASWENGAIRWS